MTCACVCAYMISKCCRWRNPSDRDHLLVDSQPHAVWVLKSVRAPSATNKNHPKGYLLAHKGELGKETHRAGRFSSSRALSNAQGLFTSADISQQVSLPWSAFLMAPKWLPAHEEASALRHKRGQLFIWVPPPLWARHGYLEIPLNFSPCARARTDLHDSLPDGHANQNSAGMLISFHVNLANRQESRCAVKVFCRWG